MGFTGHPPTGTAWGSGTVVDVLGTAVVAGTVDVVDVVPADVDEVAAAGPPMVGTVLVVVGAPGTVVVGDVVSPPDVVGGVVVVAFATVDVGVGAGGAGSAE